MKNEIIWYKDFRLLAGIILVVVSFILGFYGKLLFIARFYEPISVITGLSIWAISWLMLAFGAFLIGWGSVKLIQQRIQNEVKKTMKSTYNYTKQIPRKSINYTRSLGKKFTEKNKNQASDPKEND